jgi:hypothetical protein
VSPDHLDEAVDRALREMMGAEPDHDLAGQVLRRISTSSSSRRHRTRALAVAACLLLLMAIGSRALREWRSDPATNMTSARLHTAESPERAPARPAPSAIDAARTPSGPAAVADAATEPAVASARRPGRNPRTVRDAHGQSLQPAADAGTPESTADFAPWPAEVVAVEQLDPITAITVAPVSQAPLRIEEITIDPLEIEPLRVDPLSSSTQQ